MDSAVFSVLPKNYSYVTLVVTSTYQVFLNVYQSIRVNKFRAAAKIPYPQYMAEKAQMDASPEAVRFNCAQRAQANTMENFPHMIFGILFNGLEYPLLSASLGAIWVLGRVLYTYGYHTGDPEARSSTAKVYDHGHRSGSSDVNRSP
ncbi:GST, gst [Phaffia rhodozyma]|uniref:GST, gst n=1 Tax=Phaffia rhodozyma TaxID=264483 RepID=A0A0F7SNF9_PHARH|nr:GST, gst [Phaffia rhodozyma]